MNFEVPFAKGLIRVENTRNLPRETNLFVTDVPYSDQHPYFQKLTSRDRRLNLAYRSSRMIMNEAYTRFEDVDGNFPKEFSSKEGFNQRVWELYLNETLHSLGILKPRSIAYPDFEIERLGQTAFLEAVTALPPQREGEFDPPELTHDDNFNNELLHKYFSFRTHNALMSKVNKTYRPNSLHYWELLHVKGKPFILAYCSYHDAFSHEFSAGDVGRYIYGITPKVNIHGRPGSQAHFDKLGEIELFGRKIMPGFFTNHRSLTSGVSAILFSNFASQQKFSRMSRFKDYGERAGKTYREFNFAGAFGQRVSVRRELTENYIENWQDGITIFHNPFAINPLSLNFFALPGVTQYRYVHRQLRTYGKYNLASSMDYFFPDDGEEG